MSDPIGALRSAVTGQAWPGLPSAQGAILASLLYQFERSQWLAPEELLARQMSQLERLLEHARRTVPYYQERLRGFDPGARGGLHVDLWRELPLLSRRAVQDAGAALHSSAIPPEFGAVSASETSGSTGEPVRVLQSALDRLMWEAMTLREHYWHARDFGGKLASIRVFDPPTGATPHGTVVGDWGSPASELHATGPMALLTIDADVEMQVPWLRRHDPDYLMTYPTNLTALLDHARDHRWSLRRLREVRAVGETVSTELRERCESQWGVRLVDVYSSRELGYLALQCPQGENYHVAAECVLLEVLDESGRAVQPGSVGRLVVTPLHNYACPLVRYELEDYAELAAPCPCGRGLPTLARILGRTRNMVVLPDGRRHWPRIGYARFREIAPVRQFQLVQRTPAEIEVRLAVERPLAASEEAGLRDVIQTALGYPFELSFEYLRGRIPRGPGGKYEEFVSLLGAITPGSGNR